MITRPAISDKIEDLLALEVMAAELYEEALKYPESQKYQENLPRIMSDELEHIKLVRRILELFSFRRVYGVSFRSILSDLSQAGCYPLCDLVFTQRLRQGLFPQLLFHNSEEVFRVYRFQ